jgi:hypothetical protein
MARAEEILLDALHDFKADVMMGVLSTAELKLHSDFIAGFEEVLGMRELDVVVVWVGADAKLDLLQLGRWLVAAGLLQLGLFVFELSVVNNTTDRRVGFGGDLHQIEATSLGFLDSVSRIHDAELFIGLGDDDTNTRGANPLVEACHVPHTGTELASSFGDRT